jgi:hypothetical protein
VNEHRSSASGATRHFSYRIPIRMTLEERRIIGTSATALNRSISRYLVDLAVKGQTIRPEEKSRLRILLVMFREAHTELQGLLGMSMFADATAGRAEVQGRVQEAIRLLATLTEQLERRLHE